MAAFTSSFYHDVSLHSGAPPRDSPSTSLATLLMQLAILFHVVLGLSWAFQTASCNTRSTKTPWSLDKVLQQHLGEFYERILDHQFYHLHQISRTMPFTKEFCNL